MNISSQIDMPSDMTENNYQHGLATPDRGMMYFIRDVEPKTIQTGHIYYHNVRYDFARRIITFVAIIQTRWDHNIIEKAYNKGFKFDPKIKRIDLTLDFRRVILPKVEAVV